MSETTADASSVALPLPGFMSDGIPFALRTTLALLLAYWVSFAIQLDTAASAGVCVAIVAQPSPGMAMSKAIWRAAGTILGGLVAIAIVGVFPQNRTMLLCCFTLWLGACTFVGSVLRDFRAYGAVLCGYTVGIIAVGSIDAPDAVFLATLNRVAAILIGIISVALVNTVLSAPTAFNGLLADLGKRLSEAEELGRQAVSEDARPDEVVLVQAGAATLSLRTAATYATVELPQGRRRAEAAAAAISGILGMITTCAGIWNAGRHGSSSADAAMNLCKAERIAEFDRQSSIARDGLEALRDHRAPTTILVLRQHHDLLGAALNATRTMIAVGLACIFCVFAGWPGATLLLIQMAAFTALLGMQPNPFIAGARMGVSLVPAAIAAGLVGFVLLPQASGFVPFALAVGLFTFVFALMQRHNRLAPFGPGLLLYLTLLLSPSNTESFDLSAFMNTVLIQFVAIAFMLLAFRLILPVSRERRLSRVWYEMAHDLRRTMRGGRGPVSEQAIRTLRFDRLAQAQVWLGKPTPARLAVLRRLYRFTELEVALQRAQNGFIARGETLPPADPVAFAALAEGLLASGARDASTLRAISGLHEAADLMRENHRALRHYGLVEG